MNVQCPPHQGSLVSWRGKFRSLLPLLAIVAVSVGFAPKASAQVLYEQDFNNSLGADRSIGFIGWSGYRSATATAVTTSNLTIQSVPGTGDGSPGRIYSTLASTTPILMYGTGINISLDQPEPIQFSFDAISSTTAGRVQIVIQVEGNWYISNTAFALAAAANLNTSTPNAHHVLDFTTNAAAWSSFDLQIGTSMGIGSVLTSNLPSTTITGVGFYLTSTGGNITTRLDTLQITAVPEPGTVALVVLGGLALTVTLRRRNHRTNLLS